jgi:hypothetical protein
MMATSKDLFIKRMLKKRGNKVGKNEGKWMKEVEWNMCRSLPL